MPDSKRLVKLSLTVILLVLAGCTPVANQPMLQGSPGNAPGPRAKYRVMSHEPSFCPSGQAARVEAEWSPSGNGMVEGTFGGREYLFPPTTVAEGETLIVKYMVAPSEAGGAGVMLNFPGGGYLGVSFGGGEVQITNGLGSTLLEGATYLSGQWNAVEYIIDNTQKKAFLTINGMKYEFPPPPEDGRLDFNSQIVFDGFTLVAQNNQGVPAYVDSLLVEKLSDNGISTVYAQDFENEVVHPDDSAALDPCGSGTCPPRPSGQVARVEAEWSPSGNGMVEGTFGGRGYLFPPTTVADGEVLRMKFVVGPSAVGGVYVLLNFSGGGHLGAGFGGGEVFATSGFSDVLLGGATYLSGEWNAVEYVIDNRPTEKKAYITINGVTSEFPTTEFLNGEIVFDGFTLASQNNQGAPAYVDSLSVEKQVFDGSTVAVYAQNFEQITEVPSTVPTLETCGSSPTTTSYEVIAEVQAEAMATDSELTAGEANALVTGMSGAIEMLEEDRTNTAINRFNAFINQVEAKERSGHLDPEKAAKLKGATQDIINGLEP